jgi:predicted nucleotidyltransferase
MRSRKAKITQSAAIRIVKEFIQLCRENKLIFDKVILFGSAAKNQTTPWSDIDVAFISKDFKNDPVEDRRLLNKLSFKNEKFLDIESHPYPTSYFKQGDPFIDEIRRTGIEIK